MIVTWMLAAFLFTVLIGVAALAGERLLRTNGRAARGVWLAAMTVAVVWPMLALMMPDRSLMSVETTPLSGDLVLRSGAHALPNAESSQSALPLWLTAKSSAINTTVFAVWASLSALLLLRLLLAARYVRAMTRRAKSLHVDGTMLLVADTIGPASVGWRRPQVIVPSWVLSLDAPLRSLVLRHEQEHCRAGDPRLVWCAAVACLLVPWNAGVWWMARRLRLALELDCDARTLQHGGDRVVYAKLLLFMTQQHVANGTELRLATSLAASRSHLGRRIQAMQQRTVMTSRGARIALAALTVAAIAAACGTEIPSNVVVPGDRSNAELVVAQDSASQSASASQSSADTSLDVASTARAASPASLRSASFKLTYPPMLRVAREEGTVVVAFVVDSTGRVDMSTVKVVSSDHELFTMAVKRALVTASFDAARVNGKPVRELVELPFAFALGMESAATLGRSGEQNGVTVVVPERESNPRVDHTMTESQVGSPVSLQSPLDVAYPPMLRSAEVEGDVVAEYVVNADGSVDVATFNVIQSDHELFTHAVRTALRSAQYSPAKAGGVAVRQLTQQRFSFQLAR